MPNPHNGTPTLPPRPVVYVDIDGVAADFVGAALAVHDAPHMLDRWPGGEWNIAQVLGMSDRSFWAAIDQAGHPFWAGLALHDELMSALFWHLTMARTATGDAFDWYFLSQPSRDPGSASGKLAWMQELYGREFCNYFLAGGPKHLLARPGACLIDDSDANVDQFRAAGGEAVLVPRPWNSMHAHHDGAEWIVGNGVLSFLRRHGALMRRNYP